MLAFGTAAMRAEGNLEKLILPPSTSIEPAVIDLDAAGASPKTACVLDVSSQTCVMMHLQRFLGL
jgi:hypothetical protein